MTDYIKREDALRMVKGVQYKSGLSVVKAFDVIPSADVAPVRRGVWQDEHGKPVKCLYSVYCSSCGKWSEYYTAYCPNCGAKMDLED